MALYAIGDTHLALGNPSKTMEVFGAGWENYVQRLEEGFSQVSETDTVVLCGDISWALGLEQAREDFAFLDRLPGEKWIVKGNHDFWWNTATKMNAFFAANGFHTLHILHNNCTFYGDVALCGTRGWFYEENGTPQSEKVFRRELIRLEASLKAAGEHEKYCFLHYPPLYQGYRCDEVLDLLQRYQVRICCYAHLHGNSHRLAETGERDGVQYRLVSSDYVGFCPKKISD